MNIDDKINANLVALQAFKEADKVIEHLAYKADSEEAKAFKCLVLTRLGARRSNRGIGTQGGTAQGT